MYKKENTMDKYSTHLPILEMLFKDNKIKTVFEFGTGLYSTKLFAENAESVIACEMQDENWYNKVNEAFKDCDNVSVKCLIGPFKAIDHLTQIGYASGARFDLIFVDGHGDSRWHAINTASKFTDIIVSHDTETASYRWDLVDLDDTWERIDYKDKEPWTSVWRKK